MADSNFKDEAKPSLGGPGPSNNPFAEPSFSFSDNSDHTANSPKPLWKFCDHRPPAQQVKINEQAARYSRRYLEDIKKTLYLSRNHVPSSDTRLREAAAIEERKKYYEIRIGFIGGTGTGKSSLINALLMMNVLPENQEIASTAVPVEVSYNNDDDPAHLFIAVIEGMSMMDIAKELQQLYDDWILWKSGPDGEDDLPDVEVYERMNNTVEKFKWVFPNLQKIEDLSKTSAEELLKKQHVRKILDNKIYVQEPTESTFATAIQKYIESSKPNSEDEEAIAFWPLVKVVRIYVKAEILRNGIILVDLPGSHDTSAARVAVADNYRKNLTASVVCANADRAGSDKIAQDLLTSVERRNMQLDGLYKSDSLFFVVTKIDRLEYEKYIRDHKNLQQANQQDMKSIVSMKKEIEKLQGELEKGEEKKSRAERDSAKKKVNRDRLHGQVEKILGLAPSRKKRKSLNVTASAKSRLNETDKKQVEKLRGLEKELKQLDSIVKKAGNNLYSITKEKQRLEEDVRQAKTRVIKSCIQNRAHIHRETVRDAYERERRAMGQQSSENLLQVISVSAKAFSHFIEGKVEEARRIGFSTKNETGIPALGDALIATTWISRLRNARSFNEDVASYNRRLQLWAEDASSEYKLLDDERATVENRIDAEIKKLEQASSNLHITTRMEVVQLIENGIYEQFDETAERAFEEAVNHVTLNWCMNVAWNTHRASNKKEGRKLKSASGATFDWNEDLAGIYLENFMKDWTKTFHSHLPELLKKYEAQADKAIADFVERLLTCAHDIHPTIQEALQSFRENILSIRAVLRISAANIFEEINQAAKEAHRSVKDEVLKSWTATYLQCGAARGKKLYERNRKTHKLHVNGEGGKPMYERAGAGIQATLNKVLNQLQGKFDASYYNAVAQLREDLRVMLERHSVNSVQNGTHQAVLAKERLQKALSAFRGSRKCLGT